MAVFADMGVAVTGFAAPRNSITTESRDRLIEHGLQYDGSAAYDPMTQYLDAGYAGHSHDSDRRIMVVPFIMPNDWDARRVAGVSADEMLNMWLERLDAVVKRPAT